MNRLLKLGIQNQKDMKHEQSASPREERYAVKYIHIPTSFTKTFWAIQTYPV